jgi:hypothetical protein
MKSLHFLFLLAFLAGWVNRSQLALIEYFQTENQVYRELLGKKRIRLTDDQRRRLAVKAKVEKGDARVKTKGAIKRKERIGGLLNYYYREAA